MKYIESIALKSNPFPNPVSNSMFLVSLSWAPQPIWSFPTLEQGRTLDFPKNACWLYILINHIHVLFAPWDCDFKIYSWYKINVENVSFIIRWNGIFKLYLGHNKCLFRIGRWFNIYQTVWLNAGKWEPAFCSQKALVKKSIKVNIWNTWGK